MSEKKGSATVSTITTPASKSRASSLANERSDAGSEETAAAVSPGHGESAIPEDKKEEALENLEDDWQDDPANARNWPSRRKWIAVFVVSLFLCSDRTA